MSKKTVVIVEDEPSIYRMYKMKLESAGYNVVVAEDGKEGLETCEKTKPDLVLLDIKMPEMTGDEMLEKMRKTEWGAKIRVIVLTNISRDEAPQSLRLLGVDRYVVKAHFTPTQVLGMVEEILK